jgi:hypothetical protein
VLLFAVPFVSVVLAHAFQMGRGFIKDDFAWIAGSRVESLAQLPVLLSRHNGFYRPLVSLTFALDERLFGLWPYGYALTNLALVLLAMGVLVALAIRLGLAPWQAFLAAALWGLNWHGIGGAVLWISGRTSLLLVLFALLAALCLVWGRPFLAAVCVLLALFSKEEATLLPVVLAVWAGLLARDDGSLRARAWAAGRVALILSPPLALYLVLRFRTGAFLPSTAPDFYRPSLDVALLARNVLEYMDRAASLSALTLLGLWLCVRRRPRLIRIERLCAWLGLVWTLGGYALTVFLPVRSSLYACLPSAGVALAAAALWGGLERTADESQRPWLRRTALAAVVVLVPLLWSRNFRMQHLAELSAQTLARISSERSALMAGGSVLLHDQPDAKVSFAQAFGSLLPTAAGLALGDTSRPPEIWIDPPPPALLDAGLTRPRGPVRLELSVRDGVLVSAAGAH